VLADNANAGFWTPLANTAPGGVETMLLLSDGTVMAQKAETNAITTTWYRLTPGANGSYTNGTWTTRTSMHYSRLYYASAVLQDGRVFFAGAEYGNGNTTSEVYNPVSDSWSIIPVPAGLINNPVGFADSGSKILADGTVLVFPGNPATPGRTVIFNPFSNTLSLGPSLYRGGDEAEASAVKLPDDSVLVLDSGSTLSERYIPGSGTFINDSSSPVALYDPVAYELGPAFLLPNGKAVFFGSTGHTALYTPTGNTSPGNWVAGPDFVNGQGMPDAPGCMMVNGTILCATSPTPTAGNPLASPTSFYEYDYTVGATGGFTQVASPTGGFTDSGPSFPRRMLALPDGTVLYSDSGNQLYTYTPSGPPLAAGKPTISSVAMNADGTLHLTGTLFNGISEGANYGDDAQMDSNYPLVRFTDTSGHVRYGRSYNWSNTGVMKTNLTVTTECTVPAGASLGDSIQVVANGIASDGLSFTVTSLNDSGPGSLRQIISYAGNGMTITLATNLSGQAITLTSGELMISNNLAIDASALPGGITINGDHANPIFYIVGSPTPTIKLAALILTNGYSSSRAGGAIVNGAVLSLNNCTFAGNSTGSGAAGGAIYNSGLLTLTGCTISGNVADSAGAILNQSSVCTVQNCTFAGNTASAGIGGAILSDYGATLNLLHCTFTGNTASSHGGDIYNLSSQVSLTNTILAASTPDDIYNAASSTNTAGGSNIVQVLVNAGTLIGTNTILAVNPQLAPLGNYGGPTQTRPPLPGSPAIDAAAFTTLLTDQRGYPRVIGPAPDLGAVEFQDASPIVTTAADSGIGSLRYAATYTTNGDYITFATNLSGATIQSSGTVTLNGNLTIDASALPGGITINGNQAGSVLLVTNGNVVLTALTITNGNASSSGYGGGILNYAVLTLNQCTLAGNSAGYASGIANAYGTLVVNESTLTGNSGSYGGGILNFEGALTVNQSTLTGNSDPTGASGGVYNWDELGSIAIFNSIVAGNTLPNTSGYNNGTGTTTSGITTQTGANLTNGTPLLAPLGYYGGPTPTMPPLPGSPAIDGCTNGTTFATDQRGYPRSVGRAPDIGAVEGVYNPAGPGKLKNVTRLGNGSVSFTLTNYSDMSFTVLASTNVALPFGQWSNLGTAVESPLGSGQYPFTDLHATNYSRRFYKVASP
jgi:hypothetical protein